MRNPNQQVQFAPVAPIQILSDLFSLGELGYYHLLLAHHTVEQATKFTSLFKRVFEHRDFNYRQVTIIMDNSIVELGGAVDDGMIREAVEAIGHATQLVDWRHSARLRIIPVLPDVMGDGGSTRELSEAAYDRWSEQDDRGYSKMPHTDGYMLVTQGATWSDFMDLVDHFFVENKEDFRAIHWVGIPRALLKAGISRAQAARYIQMVAPWLKIHFLGFSDDLQADFFDVRQVHAEGIDSAVPVRFEGLLKPSSVVGPRNPEWMEKGALTQKAIRNIRNVRTWVGG